MTRTELFELALSGGACERLYRRWRPEILRIPWGRRLGVRLTEAQRLAARQQWTLAALQEYQSAAAQARVLSLLVRVRAPLDFSAAAARFPLDELAHAEVCARVANELGGGAPVAYDPNELLGIATATSRHDLLEAAVQVARLFGVGEGWSYGFLSALRRETRLPLLRQIWRVLVRDEVVHARFAWSFLEWVRPELSAADWRVVESEARTSVEMLVAGWPRVEALAPEHFSAVSPLGSGGFAAYKTRALRALNDHVVGPFSRISVDVR